MKTFLMVLTAVLLLAACTSKVTEENYAKLKEGMTEPEVQTLLGKPDATSSVEFLGGLSGTKSTWVDKNITIEARFLGGKLALRSIEKVMPLQKK